MKSQIALLGIGLVIASGVGYVELKPASNTPAITAVATPDPTTSTSTTSIPDASNTQTMIATPEKSSLLKISNPTIPRPTISGGDDDEDEDEDEGNESDDD